MRKKLDAALELTYEYLGSEEAVKVADEYQQWQYDLSECAPGDAAGRKKILEEIDKLKESEGFRKYQAALVNRDRLSEQLERYTMVKEECNQLAKVSRRLKQYDKKNLDDPYAGSKEEATAKQRKENAAQKTKQKKTPVPRNRGMVK